MAVIGPVAVEPAARRWLRRAPPHPATRPRCRGRSSRTSGATRAEGPGLRRCHALPTGEAPCQQAVEVVAEPPRRCRWRSVCDQAPSTGEPDEVEHERALRAEADRATQGLVGG